MILGYVYILKCCDGSYYTGSTKDLERRMSEHEMGIGSKYTSKRLPLELVYVEVLDRIDDAFYREHQIKRWTRKKKEALIKQEYSKLKEFAVCLNKTHSKYYSK